ncbi:hypothetical protein KM043_016556 [Ampulex compressa]|nr:hypothetical protein KM043_016556 [Ampulex compressa]
MVNLDSGAFGCRGCLGKKPEDQLVRWSRSNRGGRGLRVAHGRRARISTGAMAVAANGSHSDASLTDYSWPSS